MARRKHDASPKIAMIGHKRIPSREGGVEVVVGELAARLVDLGCIVDAYNRRGHHVSGAEFDCKPNVPLKEYKGIRLISIPTFTGAKLNALVYSFLATLRALFGGYDIIHYHAEGPCATIWIPRLFGIKTVATIHGLDWQRAKWGGFAVKYLKFGEKMAARYADELIVLSKNVQQYFMDEYDRQAEFIPNGVEMVDRKNDLIIQQKFGLHKNEYVLFLARIVPEKGLHYLISAFKTIGTDKKLVITGGSSHTDDYIMKIEKSARDDPRIVMTGFVQGEELAALYSNAYVYVLPSDVEGMPLSLLEAMSYGNCCLVSDILENLEVVIDKAISFKQGSVLDLADKLNWLLENPDIVDWYKQTASEYICSKYSWDDVANRTMGMYRRVSKKRGFWRESLNGK